MDASAWQSQRPRGGHLFMVLVAAACGVAGALGAILFRLLIRLFQGAFFGGPEGVGAVFAEGVLAEALDPLEAAAALPWYVLVAIPAAGGLLVGPLIHFFAREAKGHGVPEVMEAVAVRGGVIRPRVAFVKILASALSIGSGGSVGREGPIVQIGSAVGSVIGQVLRVPARQLRTIVGCGAAAGISATFNAPIAGALFAVEVIVGDFAVAQFSPIVIASVVATVISRTFLGNTPAFPVPEYELVSPFELVNYMIVGVVAALVGLLFVKTLYASEDAVERVPLPEWSKAAFGGLGVGAIGVFFPQVFGVGYGTIGGALEGSLPLALLGALLVAKLAATCITIASGGSGGIFSPSLFLGAMTGGFLGDLLHRWLPESTASSGAYALVTMGAVVAATTHAPLTAIIIIFELTQTLHIIPPLMAACVVSSTLAMFLSSDSIYTLKLRRRGIDLHREDDPNVLKSLYVRDVVDRSPEIVEPSAGFEEILNLLVESDHTEFFVVDPKRRLLGAISLHELRKILLEQEQLRAIIVAGDLLETNRPTVTEEDDLDVAMRIFSHEDVEEIAVVDPQDRRRLVGSLHKRDVIQARNQEMMRRDLAGGVSTTVDVADRVHQVDLGGGYVVQEVLAPRSFAGRTLREVNLRGAMGVQVIVLRAPPGGGGPRIRVPGADDCIALGDRLVVAGPKPAVDALAGLS